MRLFPISPALPVSMVERIAPSPLPDPYPVAWNAPLAAELGIVRDLGDAELLATLAGNRVPPGADPVAVGYAGHQFGVWVPKLGDGRAILLGQVEDQGHRRIDIQLKGAGMTRWSRMGDGRAVLRSTIREYLASAAMSGLGIPTTRALSIVGSDLPVFRERTETAAVLCRTAATHIRFGSFEWLASLGQEDDLRQLADQVIAVHYPPLLKLQASERHAAWFDEVVLRTARLMAAWVAAGFAHGVMNTDNFSIIGDTLDYGPFGWMERYDPGWICNHSDHGGRYAFGRQPMVGLWNCTRLAEALLSLISEEAAMASLDRYRSEYERVTIGLLRDKLGLVIEDDHDSELIGELFIAMQQSGADYTRTFRVLSRWNDKRQQATGGDERRQLATDGNEKRRLATGGDLVALAGWLERYAVRLELEQRSTAERHAAMLRGSPKYVLRNWMAEEVIAAAT
ncbi:MAG TPA: YdiU family protein, partial [Gemmatimonadales bacterium]|nr:YdiU family protein [Gemmatimonadales bacterium]